MLLPDTNLLLNAVHADSPHHARARQALEALLDECEAAVANLSEEITRLHFSHADRKNQTVGI